MKNITFTISSASSSDQSFPASTLELLETQPQGWQSSRFCIYPQELVLSFAPPINIHKVQFLSHEKKISQKVEVQISQNQNIFQRIGYFTFQNNENSNWSARELKTVNINKEKCFLLRLLLAKNHDNRFNPFNQVGIIAIRVYGEIQSLPPPASKQSQQTFQGFQQHIEDIDIDQKALQHIRALEYQKDYALKIENFDQAIIIKTRIDELQMIGRQLKQFEDQKKLAIINEDYDQCLEFKERIQEIRMSGNLVDQFGNEIRPKINYQRESISSLSKKTTGQRSQYQQFDEQSENPKEINDEFNEEEESQQNLLSDENNNLSKEQQEINQVTKTQQMLNYDDIIIPTLSRKTKKIENDQDTDPKQEGSDLENLSPENEILAQPLKPFFTEGFCKKLFSKQWAQREKSFFWLNLELAKPKEIITVPFETFFQLAIKIVQYGLQDKIEKVSSASMISLNILLNKYSIKSETSQKGEISILLDNIILVLMEKLGDLQRSKESEKLIIILSEKYGTLQIVNHLLKGITTKPKLQQSGKHIQGRLQLIHQLIKIHGIDNEKLPYHPIIDLAVRYLVNPNEGVRTASIYIITEIYKKAGVKVSQSLVNLRSPQQQLLAELFEKIDSGQKIENLLDREGLRKQIGRSD